MFALMAMKRIAMEHVWVRVTVQLLRWCMLKLKKIFFLHPDVDECLAETDLCDQNCTNTLGTYECSCRDGFNEDGFNCIGMLLIN